MRIKNKYHNTKVIYNGINRDDYYVDIENKNFEDKLNILFCGYI